MSKRKIEVERDQYGNRLHAEKPTKDGHYMGKRCGFDYKEGRYHVAGNHYQKMEEAAELEAGLRAMMEAHNSYIGKQFERIAAIRKRFWDGIRDDYELQGNLVYHGEGWISIAIQEEEKFTCLYCELQGFKGLKALQDHQRNDCKEHPLGKELRELKGKLGC